MPIIRRKPEPDDVKYMRYAMEEARCSNDRSTQNGVCLVQSPTKLDSDEFREERDVYTACNDIPAPVHRLSDRYDRPLKYQFTEHAERAVIFQCAADGVETRDATLYALWAACADCARAIVSAGIKTVWVHPFYRDHPDSGRWEESIAIGDTILQEGGVQVLIMDIDRLMDEGEMPLRFDGKEVML